MNVRPRARTQATRRPVAARNTAGPKEQRPADHCGEDRSVGRERGGVGTRRIVGGVPVGATLKQPVVDAQDRVVDGANAAQFLQALKQLLEEPTLMLL